ncbi:His-Xaa-Ser system protein HxsD [Carnimonas bestiolae]|uniref:His-Xaa-Ser system protein HxsD n=1 Tax=Carnimonas bestiolae TaxID=3402172 RepID=UPI003EDC2050
MKDQSEKSVTLLWSTSLNIDERIYPMPVVEKSIYWLADKLTILVTRDGSSNLSLSIRPAHGASPLHQREAIDLIVRNLNDFLLRERVKNETLEIKKTLIKAALSTHYE